ncbi:Oidioi.mRNA.OKI2018_I69.chr1.g3520.t1.cds [Oikopleura dioica]|uniref:Oidioi.mRNA.OKI2018_I69.chr1.g3520.t1.cds n=1 Tax=Oikopleura dioica TaxID=34765 RepID=A0ABN7SYB8_OIKDI|nr:Oidioi.mRNA.OKI2018_I69.chr1.g3520.t1.cds [Oikopleura dioica]
MSGPTEQILVTAVHLTSDGFLQVWGNSALKERSEYSIPSNREAILEGTSPSLNAISPDKIYLSLDPEDGYWYRCRVLELVDRTHMNYARLLFIDTGGQTTKSYADLIVTDDENLLGAAKCFQLKGIKPPQSNELWCEIAMDALGTLLHHTVLIEDITVRRSEGPRNIDLYVGECQDVLRTLFTYKVAKYAPTNGERKPENVRIWHIESPLSFWVVPVSSEGDARLLEYIINHEHYTSKIKPLHKKSIRRGVLCLVYSKHISPYYQFDKQSFANRDDDRILARGHILYVEKQVDEGCVVVQLVDYGRRERIPFTQIYEITQISDIVKVHPPMVKKYALQGLKSRVRCAKMACPFAQKIVKQAKADFYDFAHYAVEGDEVAERRIFESVPSTKDPTRTDLFFDGNNLCEELISEYMWNVHDCGYSTASSDESEKMETVQVSPGVLYDVKIENVDEYSENGNGVYAILTEFEEQLSSLNEKLTQANLEAMRDEDITAGRACVALWEKDQRKYAYRAEILGVYSERTVVHLLDSGTRIIISRLDPSENLFYLPPEFKQLPKQAIRCTLLRKMSGDYRSHDGGITRELMEIQQDERVVGMEVLKEVLLPSSSWTTEVKYESPHQET